jgi:F-type H+-transporting ATPase subunit b
MTARRILQLILLWTLLAALGVTSAIGQAQPTPAGASSAPAAEPRTAAENPEKKPSGAGHPGVAGELAKETREAAGEDEEENVSLKHSSMVQKLAKLTGLNVHQAHLLALGVNFAIIALLIVWAVRKNVPGVLQSRNQAIQRALEEARSASQDANRRLAEIESRLRQMDTEIGSMQASAEQEAQGEEARIRQAAEEDIRKVVQAAEQEIAAAAKLARRELANHTADLALALARKQINVDANTDQVLVRNFASKLAGGTPNDGGKEGR